MDNSLCCGCSSEEAGRVISSIFGSPARRYLWDEKITDEIVLKHIREEVFKHAKSLNYGQMVVLFDGLFLSLRPCFLNNRSVEPEFQVVRSHFINPISIPSSIEFGLFSDFTADIFMFCQDNFKQMKEHKISCGGIVSRLSAALPGVLLTRAGIVFRSLDVFGSSGNDCGVADNIDLDLVLMVQHVDQAMDQELSKEEHVQIFDVVSSVASEVGMEATERVIGTRVPVLKILDKTTDMEVIIILYKTL